MIYILQYDKTEKASYFFCDSPSYFEKAVFEFGILEKNIQHIGRFSIAKIDYDTYKKILNNTCYTLCKEDEFYKYQEKVRNKTI